MDTVFVVEQAPRLQPRDSKPFHATRRPAALSIRDRRAHGRNTPRARRGTPHTLASRFSPSSASKASPNGKCRLWGEIVFGIDAA